MIDLDFIPGSESGDATVAYNVRFDHPYTIGEFIKEFYEDSKYGNWGEVSIGDSPKQWEWWNCKTICFYRYGKWEIECPEKYLNHVIKSAHGRGGWSRYDFILVLED